MITSTSENPGNVKKVDIYKASGYTYIIIIIINI